MPFMHPHYAKTLSRPNFNVKFSIPDVMDIDMLSMYGGIPIGILPMLGSSRSYGKSNIADMYWMENYTKDRKVKVEDKTQMQLLDLNDPELFIRLRTKVKDVYQYGIELWELLLEMGGKNIELDRKNQFRESVEYFKIQDVMYKVQFTPNAFSLMVDQELFYSDILNLSLPKSSDAEMYHFCHSSSRKFYQDASNIPETGSSYVLSRDNVLQEVPVHEIESFTFQRSLVQNDAQEAFCHIVGSMIDTELKYRFRNSSFDIENIHKHRADLTLFLMVQEQKNRMAEYRQNLYDVAEASRKKD